MIKIESNISDLLKKQKVYIIWRTEKKTKMLEEYTETTLIEIYSDVNRAWDVAVELNEKAKGKTSYSIEVWEVQ